MITPRRTLLQGSIGQAALQATGSAGAARAATPQASSQVETDFPGVDPSSIMLLPRGAATFPITSVLNTFGKALFYVDPHQVRYNWAGFMYRRVLKPKITDEWLRDRGKIPSWAKSGVHFSWDTAYKKYTEEKEKAEKDPKKSEIEEQYDIFYQDFAFRVERNATPVPRRRIPFMHQIMVILDDGYYDLIIKDASVARKVKDETKKIRDSLNAFNADVDKIMKDNAKKMNDLRKEILPQITESLYFEKDA